MIKIYQEDTIIDVVNKMNLNNEDELVLEFPVGHPILHNYMSLKILKNKAWNKRITIATNDLISKNIWSSIWINYSVFKDSDFIKEKNLNQEILKHNFTFFEYLIFELKKYYRKIFNLRSIKNNWVYFRYSNPYNKIKWSGLVVLFFWLLVSIFMLIFIFYFAVSKTYIEIVPDINIKTRAINIVYEENVQELELNSREVKIPIKKINQKVSLKNLYKTTWIDYENTNRSKAQVTFINEMKSEQVFKPKTRLLAPNWILFETDDWVKIPPKAYNSSWELISWNVKANITAKILDQNWGFIWKKWNISDVTFTIPGLKFNQDKIYAKLEWQATWWDDNISYIITENDLVKSKSILEEMLRKDALSKIKAQIEQENKITWVKYEILWIKDIVRYKNIDIKPIWSVKINDKLDKFEMTWSIEIETFIYNKNSVLNFLRNTINESLLAWTDKLIYVDENSLRLTVILERTEAPMKVKATTEVDVWISFDFWNNSNTYNQKLKTLILWLDNNEAKNILLNDAKVKNITIKNTPFFIKKVSSNIDNVIMRVVDER